MNLIDWIIAGVLGLSVLVGLYRGFISSVASMGGCLVSLGASYWLTPRVAEYFRTSTTLPDQIQSYTSGIVNLGDLAGKDVAGLSGEQIAEAASKLPSPLNSLLEGNLTGQIYGTVKEKALTVTDYASRTISDAILNVICFLITFIVLVIVFHIVINLLNAIFKFPVLKQMNTVTGGIFGLLRGALLCFVALAVLPLFETLVPEIKELAENSALAKLFDSGNMVVSIIRGKL